MANDDNLVPFDQRAESEQREIARQGGIARGQQRREQKTMREWAKIFGAIPVKVKAQDGTEVDSTTLGSIVAVQMQKATKGDTKAAKFVSDLLGETKDAASALTLVVNASEEGKRNIEAIINGETK